MSDNDFKLGTYLNSGTQTWHAQDSSAIIAYRCSYLI